MKDGFSQQLARFLESLFLIFLILKLTDYIEWSWWWITAPIWIPFAISAIFFLIELFFRDR